MPKVVDHEQRQEELALAVWRVVSEKGVEATTVREVAREAGWSVGALAHYFRTKDDLLLFAFQLAWAKEAARHDAGAASADGLQALKAAVSANLDLDDESRLYTRVWINFIAHVVSDPDFAAHHKICELDWRADLVRLLRRAKELGETRADLDVETEAHLLSAFVNGLSVQAELEPDVYPPERQRELLDAFFARFSPSGG